MALRNSQPVVVPYLSHYTSRAGLEGIAETHSLWGTNFLDVNDSSEFLYAWQFLMQEAAQEALKQIPDDQKRPDYDLETEARRIMGTAFNSTAAISET